MVRKVHLQSGLWWNAGRQRFTTFLISSSVSIVNAINFFVVEVVTTVFVKPVWGLFISRYAYDRVARGRFVRLETFWKWCSWPCQISAGPFSKSLAIFLSIFTIAAALLAEFSIDSVLEVESANAEVEIFSKGSAIPKTGERSTDETTALDAALDDTVRAIVPITDSCMFRRGQDYFVNSTFAKDRSFVTTGNESQTKLISHACVLTRTEIKSSGCTFDRGSGKFVSFGSETTDLQVGINELLKVTKPDAFTRNGRKCQKKWSGIHPGKLHQQTDTDGTSLGYGLFVDEERRVMTNILGFLTMGMLLF